MVDEDPDHIVKLCLFMMHHFGLKLRRGDAFNHIEHLDSGGSYAWTKSISCNSMFSKKLKAGGTLDKYKSRFVAKGSNIRGILMTLTLLLQSQGLLLLSFLLP